MGAQITLNSADGSIIDTQTLDNPVGTKITDDNYDCTWNVSFADVPESQAYTIDVTLPQGGSSTLTYSEQELKSNDWNLIITPQ